MKAIVLCGGKGSRLQPITYTIPKQLIPIGNKPLIVYTIELLLSSGMNEIGIVVNENNEGIFKKVLKQYFIEEFQYIVQQNPRGIAHGLLHAEEFIDDEKFLMVLGDNSFEFDLKAYVENFITGKDNCKILLKEVENPEKFGVAYIGDNRIIDLEEKPKIAYSNLAITGLYAFDKNIFKACREINPSNRGEYEIIDAIRWLLQNKYAVGYEILKDRWKDIGTPIDLVEENMHRLSSIDENIKGEIVNSQVMGKLVLEEGGAIYNSIIRGPIIVGKNTIIKHSYIGPYTSIGKGVKVEKSNVENSILLDNCVVAGVQNTIDNSIIGENSMITNQKGLKKTNRLVVNRGSKVYLSNS